MGQKVDPNGLRRGVNKDWESRWYADKKTFADNIVEDNKIRTFLKKAYYKNKVSKIVIERAADKLTVNIHTAQPAILIGKAGAGVEEIKKAIAKICPSKQIAINVIEVKRADSDATLLAEWIAEQLEARGSFRRCMKQANTRAMKSGARGVKTSVSGRLDGAEIARSETYKEGSIPLQTIRADIDYGFATAHTMYGAIGVKCWIYKGDIFGKKKLTNEGGNAQC